MAEQPPDTRRSLILRLRDPSDAAAWGEFAALYEPFLYRLARHRGLQDADARDLVQEVLRALCRSADRWDPSRGRFRPWLARIARNLAINLLARQAIGLRGSGSTSVRDLIEARPSADPSATAVFEIEYRRHLFRHAADEARDEFAANPECPGREARRIDQPTAGEPLRDHRPASRAGRPRRRRPRLDRPPQRQALRIHRPRQVSAGTARAAQSLPAAPVARPREGPSI